MSKAFTGIAQGFSLSCQIVIVIVSSSKYTVLGLLRSAPHHFISFVTTSAI